MSNSQTRALPPSLENPAGGPGPRRLVMSPLPARRGQGDSCSSAAHPTSGSRGRKTKVICLKAWKQLRGFLSSSAFHHEATFSLSLQTAQQLA